MRTRSDQEQVSAVVVSYNTRDALRRCLRSLRACAGEARLDVTVIDNASTDRSADMVRREHPEVRLIPLTWNVGFARAMNLALAGAGGGHVLWLNPDAELARSSLTKMLAALARHPRAGIVVPLFLNHDGSPQTCLRRRSFYEPAHLILAACGIAHRLPVLARRLARDRYADDPPVGDADVDFANGACLLVSRAAVIAVGPLDERFLIYSEDMDYCERVRQAGFEIRVACGATVIHTGSESTSQRPRLLRRHLLHAKWQFVAKHFGAPAAVAVRVAAAFEAVRVIVPRRCSPGMAGERFWLGVALARWALHPRSPALPQAAATGDRDARSQPRRRRACSGDRAATGGCA